MSGASGFYNLHWIKLLSADDGSMNKVARDEAIEKITNSKSTKVILISFKAGSTGMLVTPWARPCGMLIIVVGLNLTCCNNVILVDPWWNPALEDQAFDRAHRFGQKRAVNIHKLCVPESVEQRILEVRLAYSLCGHA